MAPLSNAVLATVKPASAGAVYLAIESNQSAHLALLAAAALFALSIMACAAFLTWMRRVTG
jgi:hypothetical protein